MSCFLLHLDGTILLRWNTKARTVLGIAGEPGNTPYQLFNPLGLCFGPSNTLYIADYQNNRVQKWIVGAAAATMVAGNTNGTIGSGMNDFHYPADVILDTNGNVIVSDRYNCRVQLWAPGALTGKTIAGTGRINEEFYSGGDL